MSSASPTTVKTESYVPRKHFREVRALIRHRVSTVITNVANLVYRMNVRLYQNFSIPSCLESPSLIHLRLRNFYERVSKRRGNNEAVIAATRKRLVIIYHILTRKEPYRGGDPKLTEQKYILPLRRIGLSTYD